MYDVKKAVSFGTNITFVGYIIECFLAPPLYSVLISLANYTVKNSGKATHEWDPSRISATSCPHTAGSFLSLAPSLPWKSIVGEIILHAQTHKGTVPFLLIHVTMWTHKFIGNKENPNSPFKRIT